MNMGFQCAKKLLWLGIEMTNYDSNSLAKTYQLSTHLAKVLSPLIGNSLTQVQNSCSFAEFISSKVLQGDEILASFDVVSLFTTCQWTSQCRWPDADYRRTTPLENKLLYA